MYVAPIKKQRAHDALGSLRFGIKGSLPYELKATVNRSGYHAGDKSPLHLFASVECRHAAPPETLTLTSDSVMMLEEAGGEAIGTVIATLKPPDQGESAAQVNGLVVLGLIRKEGHNLVLTEQGRIAIRS